MDQFFPQSRTPNLSLDGIARWQEAYVHHLMPNEHQAGEELQYMLRSFWFGEEPCPSVSILEDNRWTGVKEQVTYTYHCNEPNYGKLSLNYRYGLCWLPAESISNGDDSEEEPDGCQCEWNEYQRRLPAEWQDKFDGLDSESGEKICCTCGDDLSESEE